MDNYIKEQKCKNCGCPNWLDIPKGVSVETFLSEKKVLCQRCNCRLGKDVNLMIAYAAAITALIAFIYFIVSLIKVFKQFT